jgi:archaellum component FlaG (FlaF/FlaG flagellin family)
MKKLLLIPALLMLVMQLSAQTTNIGISALVNAPQSVSYQDSVSYSFAVKNYGPSAFAGDIQIYTGIWDSSMTFINVIRVDSISLTNIQNFNAGDSIWITDTEHYTPANFRIGTSVVVIWPVAMNAVTADSASYTVFVQSGVKVLEVMNNTGLSVFPNPAQDKLVIGTAGSAENTEVEQVRIMNAAGQVMIIHPGAGTMDISQLQEGTYLVELVLKNGSSKVYRIIKQP